MIYSLSGEPVGASINASSGGFSWIPSNAQGPGTYTFIVIVSDTDNLTDSEEIVVTVLDLDLEYSVAVTPSSVVEGDSGTQAIAFTLSLHGATNFASQVDYVFGGTATPGVDYIGSSGTALFTAGQVSQTVQVLVIGDEEAEPDETISLTLSGGTAPSGGLITYLPQTITATIIDDDTAGAFIFASDGLTVTEAGLTDSYTITLSSVPTATVTMYITPDSQLDLGLGGGIAISRSFAANTRIQPYTITVAAVDDPLREGPHTGLISHSVGSLDPVYAGIAISPSHTLTVNIVDNDVPDILLSATTVTITEPNGCTVITLSLATQPAGGADVTVGLSPTIACTVSTKAVTIPNALWVTGQAFTITAVDDVVVNPGGQRTCLITTEPESSVDPDYDGQNLVEDITVTVIDDDTAGVLVSPLSGNTSENGAVVTFTVVLETEPTAPVTFTLSSSNLNEGLASPGAVIFNAGNWAVPQTITLTGQDDALLDGDVAYSVTLATDSNSAAEYNTYSHTLSLSNVDNELAYTVQANQDTVVEGDAGITSITFTLTRNGATATEASTAAFMVTGTATVNLDYDLLTPSPITSSVGMTQALITLNVLGDVEDEQNETIVISLTQFSGAGAALVNQGMATTTIVDGANQLYRYPYHGRCRELYLGLWEWLHRHGTICQPHLQPAWYLHCYQYSRSNASQHRGHHYSARKQALPAHPVQKSSPAHHWARCGADRLCSDHPRSDLDH